MNVWIVDDDSVFRTLVKLQFEKVDPKVKVTGYENGMVAYEAISKPGNEGLPHMILLDINMPVMSGWEFVGKYSSIRDSLEMTPQIVIVTSSIDIIDQKKAENSEFVDGFKVKPITLDWIRKVTGDFFDGGDH